VSIIEKALRAGRQSPKKHGDSDEDMVASTPEEAVSRQEVRQPAGKEADIDEAQLPEVGSSGAADYAGSEPTRLDASARVGGTTSEAAASVAQPRVDLKIPFDALAERGFLSPSIPRSRIAEEFRGIKRPILRKLSNSLANGASHVNLVMVTSALQGDGKTFTSINLATSIAMEQDKTVLFVDADVVRATAGKTLGVPSDAPGLIDLLDDNSDVEPADVISIHEYPETARTAGGQRERYLYGTARQ
jgi:protein-tyrosine kinase